MKKHFLTILFFIGSLTFAQEKPSDFPTSVNAEKAFKLQEESKKPIVFFFYTDWCKYCFAMKKNTFSNENVMELINANFHFVAFNAEGKTPVFLKNKTFENKNGTHELAVSLAAKNGYISYPSLVILNSKHKIDEQADTFLSAKQLAEFLAKYLKKKKR